MWHLHKYFMSFILFLHQQAFNPGTVIIDTFFSNRTTQISQQMILDFLSDIMKYMLFLILLKNQIKKDVQGLFKMRYFNNR